MLVTYSYPERLRAVVENGKPLSERIPGSPTREARSIDWNCWHEGDCIPGADLDRSRVNWDRLSNPHRNQETLRLLDVQEQITHRNHRAIE